MQNIKEEESFWSRKDCYTVFRNDDNNIVMRCKQESKVLVLLAILEIREFVANQEGLAQLDLPDRMA